MEKLIADDPAAKAADRMAKVIAAGGHLALAGGSTPRAAYELLAARELEWSGAHLWFGDERCVPADDERSNYGMVKEALLDRIAGATPEVHRIPGEEGPDDAAATYAAELAEALGGGIPQLDLVLLGIGLDSHTASLFPGQASLQESELAVVGVPEAGQPPHVARVTLTLPAINAAREVVFLIKGADKAEPVARAFAANPSPDVPAGLVKPASGQLTLLLDPAAAALL